MPKKKSKPVNGTERTRDIHDDVFDRVLKLFRRVVSDNWDHRCLGRFSPTKGPGANERFSI